MIYWVCGVGFYSATTMGIVVKSGNSNVAYHISDIHIL